MKAIRADYKEQRLADQADAAGGGRAFLSTAFVRLTPIHQISRSCWSRLSLKVINNLDSDLFPPQQVDT